LLNIFHKCPVLYGHSIANPEQAPKVGPERRNRLSPDDLDTFLAQKVKQVSLTFDDGYLDNLTTALPILEKHEVETTIFVTTGFVARTHVPMERVAALVANNLESNDVTVRYLLKKLGLDLKQYSEPESVYSALRGILKKCSVAQRIHYQTELIEACGEDWEALLTDMLTPEQVAELDKHPLISIGAHTVSHPNLLCAENDELNAELTESKKVLEEWIGRSVTEMAYPYGANDKKVRQAVAEAGYRRAYTTDPKGFRQRILAYHPLCKPRHELGKVIKREHGDV
jgi:peptidoglycan/xylan/chitin deacetylase (PgdA/CDA1 family)